MNKILVLVVMAWMPVVSLSQSQVNRYFIYFDDKSGENYPYSLSEPDRFLTSRAIERKKKQSIEIEKSDMPVNPEYIQSLRDVGIDVFFTSRWLNGALVNADTTLLDEVEELSFVERVRWIADTTVLSNRKESSVRPTQFTEPPTVHDNSDIQLKMLGVNTMHAENIKGQGMLIAILDGGFIGTNIYTPFQHLWENNQIIATKDFVANSGNVYQYGNHGALVLSIMASNYRSENGDMIGVVPEANYILCNTEDGRTENIVEEYNWMLGAEFADSLGADVINSSLGYRNFDISKHNYSYEDLDGNTAISSKAATMAASKGMVVVISAGNSGAALGEGRFISHPADAHNVLAVGSVNKDSTYTFFSSIGNTADGRIKPDVTALGYETTVVGSGGKIVSGSGTSFSSPLIAGFVAGIWQANPDWTSQKVVEKIKKSGHIADDPNSEMGYGIPHYTSIMNVLNVSNTLKNEVTVHPNPFNGNTIYLTTEENFEDDLKIKILDMKGNTIFKKKLKKKKIEKEIELTIGDKLPGIYLLLLQSGENQKIVKLINF